MFKMAMIGLNFSARADDKISKASRTIADLTEKAERLPEAIQYRFLDMDFFI